MVHVALNDGHMLRGQFIPMRAACWLHGCRLSKSVLGSSSNKMPLLSLHVPPVSEGFSLCAETPEPHTLDGMVLYPPDIA